MCEDREREQSVSGVTLEKYKTILHVVGRAIAQPLASLQSLRFMTG
jgi:hypothetical protein